MNKKQLRAVLGFAMKDDDVRKSMCGIFVDFDNRIVVATDTCAMIIHRNVENLNGTGSVIIPREAVEAALKKKFVGDVYITPTEINYMPYKPVDMKYPDYARAMPRAIDDEIKFGLFRSWYMKQLEAAEAAFGSMDFASWGIGGSLYARARNDNSVEVLIMSLRVGRITSL